MYHKYEKKAFPSKLKSETNILFDLKVLESEEKPRAEFAHPSLCFLPFPCFFAILKWCWSPLHQCLCDRNLPKHMISPSLHEVVEFTESLRLEKTSKIIKSSYQPITTTPAKPCPEVPHLHVF